MGTVSVPASSLAPTPFQPEQPSEPAPEDRPVLVLDFGGQYSQLIARRVREARVYSELVSHRLAPEEISRRNPAALILSGGPASVYAKGAPLADPGVFELGVPTLGICYGMQLMARELGGRVEANDVSEYGKADVSLDGSAALFHDLSPCLLYTSPSPRDGLLSRMPSSA